MISSTNPFLADIFLSHPRLIFLGDLFLPLAFFFSYCSSKISNLRSLGVRHLFSVLEKGDISFSSILNRHDFLTRKRVVFETFPSPVYRTSSPVTKVFYLVVSTVYEHLLIIFPLNPRFSKKLFLWCFFLIFCIWSDLFYYLLVNSFSIRHDYHHYP